MQAATITLKSAHGRYLTVDTTGVVKADAEVVGPWEVFTVEPLDGDEAALKTAHGTYLTAAREDPERTPEARATSIGPWEAWRVVTTDDGRVAWLGEHGGFLTAASDYTVRCEATEPNEWERWTSDPTEWWIDPVVRAAGLQGHLRIDGLTFADDTGPVLPVFAHAGDLLSKWLRDPVFAESQMDALAVAGYHGARVWFQLGNGSDAPCKPGDFWIGREVGPIQTPNYWDQVGQFLLAMQARNLRLIWSQGDPGQTGHTMSDREAYARQAANVARQVDGTGHIAVFFDAGNEAWQNDGVDRFFHDSNPDGVKNMARFVSAFTAAGGTALTSTTSPPSEDPADMDRYTPSGVSLWDVHSWRGGHARDKRRHIFTLPYENGGPRSCKVGIGSEPPGNGALVSASEYKDELDHEAMALLGAMSLIARTAHCWFSGEGVKLQVECPTEGLCGMQGFDSVPRLAALLPRDVMTYGKLHHSGDTWRGTRVFALPANDDTIRIDGAIAPDGHFAYVADGDEGHRTLPVERGFEGSIIHPGTGEVHPFSGAAGARLDVEWTRGRVIVGQLL